MRTRLVLLVLLMPLLPLAANAAHETTPPPSADNPVPSPPDGPPRGLSFAEVRADPNAYQGRSVTLGGEVLTVRRSGETIQVEVLQLPLGSVQEPLRDRAATEGRFLAFHTNGLDLKVLHPGSRITVVGEVAGSAVAEGDQSRETFPVVDIHTLVIWPELAEALPPPPESVPSSEYAGSTPSPAVAGNYLTPYWDPFESTWLWRPFWVFPLVTHQAIIVPRLHGKIRKPSPVPSAAVLPGAGPLPPPTVPPQFREPRGALILKQAAVPQGPPTVLTPSPFFPQPGLPSGPPFAPSAATAPSASAPMPAPRPHGHIAATPGVVATPPRAQGSIGRSAPRSAMSSLKHP